MKPMVRLADFPEMIILKPGIQLALRLLDEGDTTAAVACLRATLDLATGEKVETAPNSQPIEPRIVAAIKERAARTDRYGDDLVFQVDSDLRNEAYVKKWMPEHHVGCAMFRALPEDERFRILRIVLDEPTPGRGHPPLNAPNVSVKPIQVHLAIFQDEDRTGLLPDEVRWIVRSLEHDIYGSGFTQREALWSALCVIRGEFLKRVPFDDVPPAPAAFVSWWSTAATAIVDIPRASIVFAFGSDGPPPHVQIEMSRHAGPSVAMQPKAAGVARSE